MVSKNRRSDPDSIQIDFPHTFMCTNCVKICVFLSVTCFTSSPDIKKICLMRFSFTSKLCSNYLCKFEISNE